MTDTAEALVARLATLPGVESVAVELAHDFHQHLPVVQVTPGATESVPLYGGPAPLSLSYLDFDVDVFAATAEEAADLAEAARAHVLDWLHPKVSTAAYPPPARRPDFNPRVRRSGATVTLLVRP